MSKSSITEMIRRHYELYRDMDQLYALGGDEATNGPEYGAACREAMELEHRIVATRATTKAEADAKWRFIVKADFVAEQRGFDNGDLRQLVAMILQLDAEHVAAVR